MRRSHLPLAVAVAASLAIPGAGLLSPVVTAQAGATVSPSLYSGMRWRSVGPSRGGRSLAVGGSDARPLEYWFGATGGGAWKTTDGGTNWSPMTDGKISTSSIGSMAVCQSNPDVVYIGGGETQLRGNIIQGDGVYKTADGGETWNHLTDLRESQAIARLRVHPTNCDIVYAAVLGQVYNEHPQRGIFKSADGGKTWRRTLFRDDRTGGVDLSIDVKKPERDLRLTVGGEPVAVGDVQRRSRQRPVQVDRRRRLMERDHEEPRPTLGPVGQGGGVGLASRRQSGLRIGRERGGRRTVCLG